jgi:hypothetical protein
VHDPNIMSSRSGSRRRDEETGRGWQERFVNADRAAATSNMATAVAESWSYSVMVDFATEEECAVLIRSALELQEVYLAEGDGDTDTFHGIEVKWVTECSRFSVTKLLNDNAKRMSNVFLRRLLHRLEFGLDGVPDPALSDLARQLFGTAERLQDMENDDIDDDDGNNHGDGLFDVHWYNEKCHDRASNPEPMVNVYQEGGFFKRHTDMMQLTILVVLQEATDGGGTAFYAGSGDEPEQEEEETDNNDGNENYGGGGGSSTTRTEQHAVPDRVERPTVGTALIWSGQLLHAALPVTKGVRVVYVGSFDLVPRIQ